MVCVIYRQTVIRSNSNDTGTAARLELHRPVLLTYFVYYLVMSISEGQKGLYAECVLFLITIQ